MTTVAVQRLHEGARATLNAHFLALSPEDLRLRFGWSLAPERIAAYVERIDFDHDAVFGVHDDRLALVGVAHLAFSDGLAELGLSVLPAHRRRGIGSALIERAVTHARNRLVGRLFMHCLSENAPIMRIARQLDMDLITTAGEADAHLELPAASVASIADEFVTDRLALYDYAFKSQVAAWRGINAAIRGARATEPAA